MNVSPQVVVLCGGLAKRLHPITETIPKSLLDINGRPFIDFQLDDLRRMGIERVLLCVGFLGEMIRDHVGDGRRFGMHVAYSFDGPTPVGTAAALRQARGLIDKAFLLMYGDSYLRVDFREVWKRFHGGSFPALMTVFRNRGEWDRSNALMNGDRVELYRKRDPLPTMEFIDYGISALTSGVLESDLGGSSDDLSDLFEDLSIRGQLGGLEVTDRFYEIGSHAGLEEFRRFVREGDGL